MTLNTQILHTLRLAAIFWAHIPAAQLSLILFFTQDCLIAFVRPVNGKLILNLVRWSWLSLICPRGTPVSGPSTKACRKWNWTLKSVIHTFNQLQRKLPFVTSPHQEDQHLKKNCIEGV
jgi:hypothetical protein